MHLIFDAIRAYFSGKTAHPQDVMSELGITYQHATPQSISDQWWFWNCENIPDTLPGYLSELKADPMEMIGFGLSEEKAMQIRDYRNNQNSAIAH